MSNKLHKNGKNKKKGKNHEGAMSPDRGIVNIYLLLLVTFFPLVFWDFYFNIADVKFIVFTSMTLMALTFWLIYAIWNRNIRLQSFKGARGWICIWALVAVVSTIFSDNRTIALMGNDGRSFGLITVCCLAVMFILISQYRINYTFFINVFLGTASIVSLLAVVNFLGLDFIGFYDGVDYGMRELFQTTLGHVDICSNFFSVVVPISFFMFLFEENKKRRKYYFFTLWCIFMGSFAGGCDSGYIICAVTVILTLVFMDSYKRLGYAAFAALILVITSKGMMLVNGLFEHGKNMDSIAIMVTDGKTIAVMAIVMVCTCVLCFFRCNSSSSKEFGIVKKVLLAVVGCGVAAAIAVFVYFSFIDTDSNIGSMANILRFDEEWGSRRGYIWKRGMQYYADSSFIDKLIGVGPDTLQQALSKVYGDEMLARFSAYYDNMHNEYMQYLITTGIFGLVSYIGVVVCVIKTGIANMKNNIYVRALLSGVICYLVQAMVNVNQILTTPYLFIAMAMIYASLIPVAKEQ